MNYKISVVIPVYNAENTLKNAIDSVLDQNWDGNFTEDIEIILVDDHSSDSSLKIMKKYSQKFKNIKYYSFSNNSGFGGRGRNKGIELAEGEFIILMDNDDIYLKNAFKTLYNAAVKNNAEIVSANYKDDILKEKRMHCPKKYNQEKTINPTRDQHTFDIMTTSGSRAPWAKIYRTSFLNEHNIRFVEDSQFDDAEFFIKCILNCERFHLLPHDYVYVYYTYSTSQVRLHDKKHFDARLKTIKEMDLQIKEKGIKSDVFITYCLMDSLLILCTSDESKKDKMNMINDLYEFENTFDNIHFDSLELNLLNNSILSKNFTLTYWLSKAYKFVYTTDFIRKLYRRYNNMKFANKK